MDDVEGIHPAPVRCGHEEVTTSERYVLAALHRDTEAANPEQHDACDGRDQSEGRPNARRGWVPQPVETLADASACGCQRLWR